MRNRGQARSDRPSEPPDQPADILAPTEILNPSEDTVSGPLIGTAGHGVDRVDIGTDAAARLRLFFGKCQQSAGHALTAQTLRHREQFHLQPTATGIADEPTVDGAVVCRNRNEQITSIGRAEQDVIVRLDVGEDRVAGGFGNGVGEGKWLGHSQKTSEG